MRYAVKLKYVLDFGDLYEENNVRATINNVSIRFVM